MKHDRKDAYEFKSVCIGVPLDVFRQVSAGHPVGNELEGTDSNTQ